MHATAHNPSDKEEKNVDTKHRENLTTPKVAADQS
jgi:hypothetical protein